MIQRALWENEWYPLAIVTFGNLLFETGYPEKAVHYYLKARNLNENDTKALIGLGNAYYDTSEFDKANF